VSEENVEIVRRVMEAWERRDSEALFALYDPAIVWDVSRVGGPITGLYHGHEGVRQYFREWLESFEDYHAQAETFIDAGDSVVVGYRASGRGKASGVEVGNWVFWLVYTIRNGLVTRIQPSENKAQALEAAGLAEDAHTSS
jgi:ketosteroid isomerase-like protein